MREALLQTILTYLDESRIPFKKNLNQAIDFITDGEGPLSIKSLSIDPVSLGEQVLIEFVVSQDGHYLISSSYLDFEMNGIAHINFDFGEIYSLDMFKYVLKNYRQRFHRKFLCKNFPGISEIELTKAQIVHLLSEYVMKEGLYRNGEVHLA